MNPTAYTLTLSTTYVVIMDALLALVLMWSMKATGASLRSMFTWGFVSAVVISALTLETTQWHLAPAFPGSTSFFIIMLGGVALVTVLLFILPPGITLKKGGHEWLLFPQGMRALFGAGFLIEGVCGIMPSTFAIADGLTHITAAVLSLWTALLWNKGKIGRGGLLLTNLFGLLDIVMVAGGIAFVLLQDIGTHHNIMIAAFYAAPIFVALHVLSLQKLAMERR